MGRLYIYWWALKRADGNDNYGDILAPFLAEKLSGKKVVRVKHPMRRRYRWFIKHYVTVGSIIWAASKKSIVWGSGIIKKNENVRDATFLAVRGPRTRARLLELGYEVPEVYGDPALLLPEFIPNTVEKKYALGIIPHYVDYAEIQQRFAGQEDIKVINLMTDDIIRTTQEIMQCEAIISSSLHGVIVSHTYNIPALWVKFSSKLAGDNVKFYDYFESVGINYNQEFSINPDTATQEELKELLKANQSILSPDSNLLAFRKEQLLASCPFKK
nr:polysaccharide pyruvyl transferase family protein [uncultured Flavobacterium sp.]